MFKTKAKPKVKSASKPKKVKKLTKEQLKKAVGGAPMGWIISVIPPRK